MRPYSKYLLILVILVSVAVTSHAQRRYKGHYKGAARLINPGNLFMNERVSLYGTLGLTSYYGDLCDKWDCMSFRPNFGVGYQHRTDLMNTRFSYRIEANYYRLGAKKDVHEVRNLSFRSGNMEFYTAGVFDFYPFEKHYRRRPLASPYLFVGVGITTYGASAQLDGTWYKLRPLQTEGVKYGSIAPIIPFGGGIRIKWNYNIDLIFEAGYRFTFTDRLDDVSNKSYQDPSTFSDPVALALQKRATGTNLTRGNPNENDGYFIFKTGVRYTFGKNNIGRFRGKQHLLRKH